MWMILYHVGVGDTWMVWFYVVITKWVMWMVLHPVGGTWMVWFYVVISNWVIWIVLHPVGVHDTWMVWSYVVISNLCNFR